MSHKIVDFKLNLGGSSGEETVIEDAGDYLQFIKIIRDANNKELIALFHKFPQSNNQDHRYRFKVYKENYSSESIEESKDDYMGSFSIKGSDYDGDTNEIYHVYLWWY